MMSNEAIEMKIIWREPRKHVKEEINAPIGLKLRLEEEPVGEKRSSSVDMVPAAGMDPCLSWGSSY